MSELVNPVGDSQDIINDKVEEVINAWLESHPEASTWWKRVSVQWVEVVSFLMRASDYFIKVIDKLVESGPDKKATVLESLAKVYDAIVPGLLP